jgi:hypothetical protein
MAVHAQAPEQQREKRQQQQRQQKSERCPNEPFRAADGDYEHAPDSVRVPLAGDIEDIPEYHDCQRLLTQRLVYGPLVGIWAREFIDKLTIKDYVAAPVAVAELHNFSNVPYAPLGIGVGYNCLYMQRVSGVWTALMLHTGTTRICPVQPPSTGMTVTPLEVKVQPNSAGQAPAAARWDMDPRSNIQYMGVWCPDGWCEIGVRGFQPSMIYNGNREERVKGWYDEQYLAVIDATTGQLRPSSIRARTIPAPNLESLNDDDFDCIVCFGKRAGWVKVATILIEKDSANYYLNKLNLRTGVPNHLFIRNNRLKRVWEARIQHTGSTAHRTNIRIDHGNMRVPGTSRWHFMGVDETVWVRCSFGCCDVLGF